MKIPSKTWQNYIKKLAKINTSAAAGVVTYMVSHDVSTYEGTKALIDYAYAVSTKYGEAAAELSCQLYDAIATASKAAVPAAEPAATATYGEIAKTIYGTLASTKNPDAVGAAVGRSVKLASVDTLQQNALRDGAEWAWIPAGDSCPFCIMLASNGWQKASKKAIKNGHASHIHNNCDCTYCVRFDHETTVEGYGDGEEYFDIYDKQKGIDPAILKEVVKDGYDLKTPKGRMIAMSRAHRAANREHINAQKRAAYAKRSIADDHNKGPVTSNLDAPTVFNDDAIVDEFMNSIEVPKDPVIIEKIRNSVKHMAKEDLDFIREKGLVVRKTNRSSSFVRSRRSRGSDGKLKYVIRINKDMDEPFVFAHECAHLAEKVNKLYKDDEFLHVLDNLSNSLKPFATGKVDGEYYVTAVSDFFIEPYQGRTYITELEYLRGREIFIEDLVEYISDGYECFVGDPALLEKKDPVLYNYFVKRGLR